MTRTRSTHQRTRTNRSAASQLAAASIAVGLLAAACGSDSDSGGDTTAAPDTTGGPATTAATATTTAPATTAAPEPTAAPATTAATDTTAAPETTSAPETTDGGGGELPDTPVVASLDDAYTFDGGVPDPALLPAEPGTVEVRWYRSGDVLAAVYDGLDADVDACPGNSAQTAEGFIAVSNAALPNGDCPDFPTLIDNTPTQGVQICDGRVGYLTLIPADSVANLFASVEKPEADVGGVGITGFAQLADPTVLPEITADQLSC
ncbi:MAG: hypothetical protein AAGA42_15610 [Actinomycetota bacterium]